MFDVQARVCDLQAFYAGLAQAQKEGRTLRLEDFERSYYTFHLGTLVPGAAGSFRGDLPLGDGPHANFNVQFFARNGQFSQQIRLRKVEGTWVWANRVTRGDTTVHESVDARFPRGPAGDVNWDSSSTA